MDISINNMHKYVRLIRQYSAFFSLNLTWWSSLCALLIPKTILAGFDASGRTTQARHVRGERPDK